MTEHGFMNGGGVRPIGIAILAMGGEGGGVLADWLVELAEHEGYPAQTTSVPGVAQRTGATIYYVEFYPRAVSAADLEHEPVLALVPVPGDVDIVVASELMEMGRAIQRGLVSPDRTTLVASTHRVYSMTEKIAMGDGRVAPTPFIEQAARIAKRFVHADFAALAEQQGSVISAALFGALAGTGALPFSRQQFEAAVRRAGVGVDSSLKAFAAGFSMAADGAAGPASPVDLPANLPANLPGKQPANLPKDAAPAHAAPLPSHPAITALDRRIDAQFPPEAHQILRAGVRRLADYQDPRYAAEYLERLAPVCELDRRHGASRWLLLSETARHLALWMSYEDTVRVADLKIRATRFERVRAETRTASNQLLHINEFLHPRVDEIADTLPAALGRRLMRPGLARSLVERFTREGRVVRTTSLPGYALLYGVASLRGMRRGSLRFAREHGHMARWLAHITRYAPLDYALATEVARCQRLVKGYGDTHLRGMQRFQAIEAALPHLEQSGTAADQVKQLAQAALADEDGVRFEELLRALQAPAARNLETSRAGVQ